MRTISPRSWSLMPRLGTGFPWTIESTTVSRRRCGGADTGADVSFPPIGLRCAGCAAYWDSRPGGGQGTPGYQGRASVKDHVHRAPHCVAEHESSTTASRLGSGPAARRSSAVPTVDRANMWASLRDSVLSFAWQRVSMQTTIQSAINSGLSDGESVLRWGMEDTYRQGPQACRVRFRDTLWMV